MENWWYCDAAIYMEQVEFVILNLVCIRYRCLCLCCDSLKILRESEELERRAVGQSRHEERVIRPPIKLMSSHVLYRCLSSWCPHLGQFNWSGAKIFVPPDLYSSRVGVHNQVLTKRVTHFSFQVVTVATHYELLRIIIGRGCLASSSDVDVVIIGEFWRFKSVNDTHNCICCCAAVARTSVAEISLREKYEQAAIFQMFTEVIKKYGRQKIIKVREDCENCVTHPNKTHKTDTWYKSLVQDMKLHENTLTHL